jgi:hypothetical protein
MFFRPPDYVATLLYLFVTQLSDSSSETLYLKFNFLEVRRVCSEILKVYHEPIIVFVALRDQLKWMIIIKLFLVHYFLYQINYRLMTEETSLQR